MLPVTALVGFFLLSHKGGKILPPLLFEAALALVFGALVCGIVASRDRIDGTLQYFRSLPISRAEACAAKTAMISMLALGSVIVAALIVFVGMRLSGGRALPQLAALVPAACFVVVVTLGMVITPAFLKSAPMMFALWGVTIGFAAVRMWTVFGGFNFVLGFGKYGQNLFQAPLLSLACASGVWAFLGGMIYWGLYRMATSIQPRPDPFGPGQSG